MTRREALTAAASRLAANPHLGDTAARDAELLLLHALHITRTQLLAYPDLSISENESDRFESLIARRLTLEPIQYITGVQEFYGLTLRVTPAVLIPRPETELLVEAVLDQLRASPPSSPPLRIADIGTGSGAIVLALAAHLPTAQLTAIDLSPAALAIAKANAEPHHLDNRIRFLQSDLLATLTTEEPFDVIVSNPPYVPESDRATLHPQVRDHEPASALFAGPAGLDIYARLIPQAFTALKPNGLLALEIGYGQAPSLRQLLAGWRDLRVIPDLQQIPRVVHARRP